MQSNSNLERHTRLRQRPVMGDPAMPDTSEQVSISALALLKMLKHGRAGIPAEVMGLMLGDFVDDYTVRVVDVFAMPQAGTGVSVEAVDPVFQKQMMDQLKETGRPEMVVGWYHSHPGFGCWLSAMDIDTQKSFEMISRRAVAVVIDPIQSVKGKVIIDAFRLINRIWSGEARQVTSNLGHLNPPTFVARVHGLNLFYYSLAINFRKSESEQKMLSALTQNTWCDALQLRSYVEFSRDNQSAVDEVLALIPDYNQLIRDEESLTAEQLALRYVGKQDPKRHLEEKVNDILSNNLVQSLAAMLSTLVLDAIPEIPE